MGIRGFSPVLAKKLGYYVYLYVNPLNGTVFYVGKGKDNRVFSHLNDKADAEKTRTIREIRANGKEPRIEILAHGLSSEEAAYRIEAAVIDALGVDSLTNDVRGWRSGHYGRMDVEKLVSLYEAKDAAIKEPAILIRINQLFRYGMSDVELYDSTRGIWRVGPKREKARLAFAVFESIVQEVYEIHQWFPAGTTFSTRGPTGLDDPDRWEFVGRLATESIRRRYRLKSVRRYLNANSQNPIAYVNCD